jgi:hypothetical protein
MIPPARRGGRPLKTHMPKALPLARTDLADGGYSAWQVDAGMAKVQRLRLAIIKRNAGRLALMG